MKERRGRDIEGIKEDKKKKGKNIFPHFSANEKMLHIFMSSKERKKVGGGGSWNYFS